MNKKELMLIIVAFACDQVSKIVISSYLKLNETITVIKNFFNITYSHNYGAAWGILKNNTSLLIVFSIIALIILLRYRYSFKKNTRNEIAFSLLIGGIAGNLVDRVCLGYVRDFLDFKIFNYDYPIFNLADAFIVIGVILLIIAILKGEEINGSSSNKRKKTKNR